MVSNKGSDSYRCFRDVVPGLLRAGLRSTDSFHVSHQRAVSSYCLDQAFELKDSISDCQPSFTRNTTDLYYKYFNIIIQPLKVWQLLGKGCLQRGIFSKHFIGSFRSSSFFFMWRIFFLSVRCPELKDVKMTRCSNHSWIQIVLSLVGAGSIPMIVSCLSSSAGESSTLGGWERDAPLFFFFVSFGP